MKDVIAKARGVAVTYHDLLLEKPATTHVKRFLFAVNGWCNSKCTFCNIWTYSKKLALSEEITLEELEQNLFGSPALKDVLSIGITGGEPFLRRDIVAVCEALYRHFPKAQLGFVTNGLLPDRIADLTAEIVAAHPARGLSIGISLDGYRETHDRVRGVPGNFERVLKTVELLKAKTPGVELGISHTVTPTNMQDALRCYELSRELGIGFMYRLAHESTYLRNEGLPIWSPETQHAVAPVVQELNRRLVADQSPLARVANVNYASIAFYTGLLDYFERPHRTAECYSGTHSFFLAHNGDVHPCIFIPHAIGNIRRQRFDDIWFSQQAADIRAPIAAWQCHCWTNCETEFSLARQKGSFLHSIQENWRSPRQREQTR